VRVPRRLPAQPRVTPPVRPRPLERCAALRELLGVPKRTILVGEWHQFAVRESRGTSRVVAEHQRGQPVHLRLVRHQRGQHAAQLDRFGGELELGARSNDLAVGERVQATCVVRVQVGRAPVRNRGRALGRRAQRHVRAPREEPRACARGILRGRRARAPGRVASLQRRGEDRAVGAGVARPATTNAERTSLVTLGLDCASARRCQGCPANSSRAGFTVTQSRPAEAWC
jgi:hypothetical protein